MLSFNTCFAIVTTFVLTTNSGCVKMSQEEPIAEHEEVDGLSHKLAVLHA